MRLDHFPLLTFQIFLAFHLCSSFCFSDLLLDLFFLCSVFLHHFFFNSLFSSMSCKNLQLFIFYHTLFHYFCVSCFVITSIILFQISSTDSSSLCITICSLLFCKFLPVPFYSKSSKLYYFCYWWIFFCCFWLVSSWFLFQLDVICFTYTHQINLLTTLKLNIIRFL